MRGEIRDRFPLDAACHATRNTRCEGRALIHIIPVPDLIMFMTKDPEKIMADTIKFFHVTTQRSVFMHVLEKIHGVVY